MSSTAMITARIPQETKESAAVVLEEMGMSASQVVNIVWKFLSDSAGNPASASAVLDGLTEERRKAQERAERRAKNMHGSIVTSEAISQALGRDVKLASVSDEELAEEYQEVMFSKYVEGR
ncbi:MAG: type II toxin-antitoxin system RelB/DinJ family antitoxin [Coriobacteriia bacterium]|nr:type II toxin-antitoxin system RelB/DinJ family antitoxin [Coriobacteriia bacterium]